MRCSRVVPVPVASAILVRPRGEFASGIGSSTENEAPTLNCDVFASSRFDPRAQTRRDRIWHRDFHQERGAHPRLRCLRVLRVFAVQPCDGAMKFINHHSLLTREPCAFVVRASRPQGTAPGCRPPSPPCRRDALSTMRSRLQHARATRRPRYSCHSERAERVEESPEAQSDADETKAIPTRWRPFDSAASEAAPLRVTWCGARSGAENPAPLRCIQVPWVRDSWARDVSPPLAPDHRTSTRRPLSNAMSSRPSRLRGSTHERKRAGNVSGTGTSTENEAPTLNCDGLRALRGFAVQPCDDGARG